MTGAEDPLVVALLATAALLRGHGSSSEAGGAALRLDAAAQMITRVGSCGPGTRAAASSRFTALRSAADAAVGYGEVLGRRPPSQVTRAEYARLDEVTERLLDHTTAVSVALAALSLDHAPQGSDDSDTGRLADAARLYAQDAVRERRAVRGFLTAAGAATVLAAAGLGWGLVRLGSSPGPDRLRLFAAHLAAAIVLAACGGVLLRAADRRSRLAGDYLRQQRQLSAVDAYLAPMPPGTRHLMRAALAPRLFARAVDDDDPLRDPVWPSPADVLAQLRVPAVEPSGAPGPSQGGGGGGGTR